MHESHHKPLHDEIAAATGLRVDEFVIARKLVDKFAWKIIAKEKNHVSCQVKLISVILVRQIRTLRDWGSSSPAK